LIAFCSRSTTPFAENLPGAEWLKTLPLGPEDTEKLLNGNARRLLKL
jgi:predicted TIM-barrel fold metal-dependent hydrolase